MACELSRPSCDLLAKAPDIEYQSWWLLWKQSDFNLDRNSVILPQSKLGKRQALILTLHCFQE